jgi:hypothetical protein
MSDTTWQRKFIDKVSGMVEWVGAHKYLLGIYVCIVMILVTSDRLNKAAASGSDDEQFGKVMTWLSAIVFGLTTVSMGYDIFKSKVESDEAAKKKAEGESKETSFTSEATAF